MVGIYLGLDIGTGSTKVVATSDKGLILDGHQEFYASGQDNYSEIDPEIIWTAFINSLTIIQKKIKGNIVSVTLSSCMHSLILIDNHDQPITPLITWADNRSESISKDLRDQPFAEALYTDTGTPIHAMSPLCKIAWFKQNQQQLFNAATKFIGIKEFIWFRLFNQYQVDYSIASATGLWNLTSRSWNPLSLKIAGIKDGNLSEIVPCSHRLILLTSRAELLFLNNSTFCIGSTDGCLANIGSFVLSPDQAALTIGTSGAVRTTLTSPNPDYGSMLFNYLIDDHTVVNGGPVNNGGNVIQWLLKTYLHKPSPSENDYLGFFNTIMSVPAGSEGLICLPYLNGERAPVWNEHASGSFIGIRNHHTTPHFLNAALEGICFALNQIITLLEKNHLIKDIHASGGFTGSPLWLQMLSDISGKRILLYYKEDASALGAAFFGLKAEMLIDDYTSIKKDPLQIFEPHPDKHLRYKKYQLIYNKMYRSINELSMELRYIE